MAWLRMNLFVFDWQQHENFEVRVIIRFEVEVIGMPLDTHTLDRSQADRIRLIDEDQFDDVKAIDIAPRDLTKHISAFANADGGDLYIGITDKERKWEGFSSIEAANGHLQVCEELFPLGMEFNYEFLRCDAYPGLILAIQVSKSLSVVRASNGTPYLRRGAQSLPQSTPEKVRRLELAKGVTSFEAELVNDEPAVITESVVTERFIREVVPTTEPVSWLRKQHLLRDRRPTVAGVLLFAEEPQASLPKQCGIKVYRYKTRESEGARDTLADDPATIEGHLYSQIFAAVRLTKDITESIPRLTDDGMSTIFYPPETLHEIVTNAVLHRDYSIKDDVHIRIFDDRVEVQSPGRLPANITPSNILDERFARNGTIVRILNKFPDPPNKDVGEGLNTAFIRMRELGLKSPVIKELENAVLVTIKHEPLASPAEQVLAYLDSHAQIKNGKARELTNVRTDFRMKSIFNALEAAGEIEKVPGTRTSATAWRKRRR